MKTVPKPLKQGDRVAIAAPAGPFDRKFFLQGVARLKKYFNVSFEKGIFTESPDFDYLAGNDTRRARELASALADPDLGALLFARGGYGCQRLLPILDTDARLSKIASKIVIGSSDLTVILNYLWQRFGLPSYYGPMVVPHLFRDGNIRRMVSALTRSDFHEKQKLVARKVLKSGRAEGTLVGGCLSLVASTLGTPWEIRTRGTLLFLEDVHEQPYAVDRMLTQLAQAGKFKGVRGLIFGTFKLGKTLFPSAIERVVRDRLKDFAGPILWGLRFGHCDNPLFIPCGGKGRIVGNRLDITQGVVK